MNFNITHQEHGSRFINILGNISLQKNSLINFTETILIKKFGTNGYPVSTVDPLRSIPVYLFLEQNKTDNQYKLIHLVRDPRNFVTSFMNWKNSSFKRQILHHLVPFWQPNPWLEGEVTLLERLRMSKFEHFCYIWQFKNNLFSTFSDQENYLCVRFEDLVLEKNKEVWEELYSFMELTNLKLMDLNWSKKKANKSDKKYFPSWKDWTSKQAQILNKWCGGLMKDFNYGQEKKWLELLR